MKTKILCFALALFMVGCAHPRRVIFIDNGAPSFNGRVMRACAEATREALYENPTLPGDLMFQICIRKMGVRTI